MAFRLEWDFVRGKIRQNVLQTLNYFLNIPDHYVGTTIEHSLL